MAIQAKIDSMSVLVPDGETWEAVKVLRCLHQAQTVTTHVLANAHWPLARFSRFCSSWHRREGGNDDDWIRVVRSLARRFQIDVILPVTREGVEFVARNRAAISEFACVPPVSDFELLVMAQDKWSFHCFAERRGFPIPASVLVSENGEDLVDSLDVGSIEYPALLKPTLLAGGFGIVRVRESSDFHRAWKDERIMRGQRYMLQSYVPGIVFCMSLNCHGGKIIAHTLWKTVLVSRKRPYFSARVMEYVDEERIIDLSTQLVSAMGWDGIANIDFLVDARDGTVNILDFNPLFGQSLLGSLVAGVNFPLLACLGAMGVEYPSVQQRTGVRYVHPVAQSKMLISQFIGKRMPVGFRWREGGLQFAVRDPLPELVDAFQRIVKQFQRPSHFKR